MKELLVPVGNFENLEVAIHSGADAVYLGGKKFGARAFAGNFDDDEMVKAIKLCHLYGVKIYVTVNTMIYESEIRGVLDYLKFLHQSGVDAVIIQDIGLIAAARKMLPNLEIHASTQMHNISESSLKILEDFGVKRVVFARELSLREINKINTTMEKEIFIHGALCISYSGECLFSSMLMDRSGNRGSCAQICRLPFKLYEEDTEIKTDGEYLLSTKELCTAPYFLDILKSDIISLKIEGRMKSAEYVGAVTKLYRELIDSYYQFGDIRINPETLADLQVIFNREYTKGFLNNELGKDLMNIKRPNHLGRHLGNITKITDKYIFIKLEDDICQGDGIRFLENNEGFFVNYLYDEKLNLISRAKKGSIVAVLNKVDVHEVSNVNKTSSVLLTEKYAHPIKRRIPVKMKFIAKLNEPLILTISDGVNEVTKKYGNADMAKNAPMDKDRVESQLAKLGNTPFILDKAEITIDDNLFINIKDINEIRRLCVDELQSIRENVHKEVVINNYNAAEVMNENFGSVTISVLCRTEEQIEASLENNVKRIYVPDKDLFLKYQNYDNVIYRTPRASSILEVDYPVLATELGSIYNNRNCIVDYFLNIANHESFNYLSKYARLLTLSVELKDDDLEVLMNHIQEKEKVELVIYAPVELMITKYCPLNKLVNKTPVCNVCRNNKKYYLVDRNNKKYRILEDFDTHLTHILNYQYINRIDKIDDYKMWGISNYRLEFLEETKEETTKIIRDILSKL